MEYRVSRFPMPSRFLLTANEKDFSLALEMTVWESYAGTWLSLLPMEGGAPKGRRLAHIYYLCLSYHSHPIRPCGAPSPRGEGCDARIPSSKKAAKPPPYNKAPSTSVGMTFKEDG